MSSPDDPWEGVELERIGFHEHYEDGLRLEGPRVYARVLEAERQGTRFVALHIHPDDVSEGAPELWVVVDPYTGEDLLEVAEGDLEAAFGEHPDWVELEAFVDDVRDELK